MGRCRRRDERGVDVNVGGPLNRCPAHQQDNGVRCDGRPERPELPAVKLTGSVADNDGFVRELHHRVKNNFQIIASLINLQKRMLPVDRRGEVRFVEEHVQSMAAAYRIVTVTDGMVQVALRDLVAEVVDALRQIAGVGRGSVNVELPAGDCFVRIDQAVAMALYLAVLVPPYLDATDAQGHVLQVAIKVEDPDRAVLSVATPWKAKIPANQLRRRLASAYLRQLFGEIDPTTEPGSTRVRIHLQSPHAAQGEAARPAST
jgi:hypothetical protein